jgi:hypothetical protein
MADGKNVLEIMRNLRKDCEDSGRESLKTREQRGMVVGYLYNRIQYSKK